MAPATATTVRAAVVDRPGEAFAMRSLELDAPRDDEILVRIVAAGLCHTDVVAQQGAFGTLGPAVFGHEGAGIVEATGAAIEGFAPGDRVAISFRSCGTCAQCGQGYASYCRTMPQLNYAGGRPDGSTTLRDGDILVASNFFGQSSFASHALTYARNLVRLPDDFPIELAGPLGCGVQTGVGAILRSLDCVPGSSVLIAGGGAVGLSAVMGAAIRGCGRIVVIEPHAERRRLAIEFGATVAIDPADPLADALLAAAPEGFDYALDTTGRQDVLSAIFASLTPRGLVGLVGVAAPGSLLPAEINTLMTFGHRVMGIIEGDSDPATAIPELIEYYRAGQLPIDRMVSTYPLSSINEAVRDHHDGACIKAVLIPD